MVTPSCLISKPLLPGSGITSVEQIDMGTIISGSSEMLLVSGYYLKKHIIQQRSSHSGKFFHGSHRFIDVDFINRFSAACDYIIVESAAETVKF